ncbi:hypothetical protein [Kribbella sp. VKM Ac-2568]|uniref:hypothetical protein n=1 Tax=Kribbella sp. VKM Ac-2568 TaxID=2512219 RepID=UPI0010DE5CB4|nr:hypothetical protein [Kribbella sp. VKM Ac-2568]TCM46930.1 hypothetical protein EV648_105408 [Kribbella sp. VKM Ac-2568]
MIDGALVPDPVEELVLRFLDLVQAARLLDDVCVCEQLFKFLSEVLGEDLPQSVYTRP